MADRQDTEWNDGAEPGESATLGNRPATGARLVDHAAGLPTGFGGGQEATDFLGLSHELGGMDVVTTPATGPAPTPAGWAPANPSASPDWLLSEKDPSEAIAPTEAEPTADTEELASDTGRSRRFVSLAAGVLVIGAAVAIAMKFSSGPKPHPPQIANPAPARAPVAPKPFELSKPEPEGSTGRETVLAGGESVPVPPVPADTVPTVEASPPVETTARASAETPDPDPLHADPDRSPRAASGRLTEWMQTHGWAPQPTPEEAEAIGGSVWPARPSGWSSTAILAFATRLPLSLPEADRLEALEGQGSPEGSGPAKGEPFRPSEGSQPSPAAEGSGENGVAEPARLGALRFATPEDMAGIWNGTGVPPEALDSPTRLLTPAVGNVRVVLKVGEIFDGRLYAVGQGQVWLETTIGRLALNAQHVLRIDQILVDKDAKIVDALPRMRVRTPGGLFFGKVLSRDERHVTLLLEGGGRITLESTDVEPAPLGDTRVVGPVGP